MELANLRYVVRATTCCRFPARDFLKKVIFQFSYTLLTPGGKMKHKYKSTIFNHFNDTLPQTCQQQGTCLCVGFRLINAQIKVRTNRRHPNAHTDPTATEPQKDKFYSPQKQCLQFGKWGTEANKGGCVGLNV